MERRRKSLLIGINYTGSSHELRGCLSDIENVAEFLRYRNYPEDQRSQVILRDDADQDGPFYPNGHNMLAAMDWLVSEPNTTCFLHYSGHGGQVPDPDGDRTTGLDDTIVPVDFETKGMIDSDTLHRHLVTALAPGSTLFIVFDCCHSGSAVELPFVYKSDENGNVNLMDNLKKGAQLVGEAEHLIQGGFTFDKLGEARELFSGATDFFRGLKHMGQQREEEAGLEEDQFKEDWGKEHKWVTMFSGCRDDQTSADASISGNNVGAMSWAFLDTMKKEPNPTYLNTLQITRQTLGQSHYTQVPQLSVGMQFDLDSPLMI